MSNTLKKPFPQNPVLEVTKKTQRTEMLTYFNTCMHSIIRKLPSPFRYCKNWNPNIVMSFIKEHYPISISQKRKSEKASRKQKVHLKPNPNYITSLHEVGSLLNAQNLLGLKLTNLKSLQYFTTDPYAHLLENPHVKHK